MTEEKLVYDNLRAGTYPQKSSSGILAAGQNLKRGAVLGLASGKLKLLDKSAADESKNPYAILAEDTDAMTNEKTCPIYFTGDFNKKALVFAIGTVAEDVEVAARKIGLFFEVNG